MSTQDIPKRVIIECDRCKAKLRVPTGKVGVIECPRCQSEFNADTRDNNDLTNCDRPKEYDVVLGGESPIPFNSVVLGGLEGVKHRLKSDDIHIQTAALSEALKYGDLGIDLAISYLKHENNKLALNTYKLLKKHSQNNKIKEAILQFNSYKFLTRLYSINIGKKLEYYYKAHGVNFYSANLGEAIISPDAKFIITTILINFENNYDYDPVDIQVWNLSNGELLYCLKEYDICDFIAITPNSHNIVSGHLSGMIKIWDLQTGKLINTLLGHTEEIYTIAISSDNNFIVSGDNKGIIKIWDLQTGKLINTILGHSQGIITIVISLDNKTIISSSYDKTIRVCSLETGDVLYILGCFSESIDCVAIFPDGQTFVTSGCEVKPQIWDLQTGAFLNTLEGNFNGFSSFIISSNTNFIIGENRNYNDTVEIPIWNLQTQKIRYILTVDSQSYIHSLDLKADNILASHSCDLVKIWNIETGELLRSLETISDDDLGRNTTVSPDGNLIVVAEMEKLEVWGI